jgi:hypothetical protein
MKRRILVMSTIIFYRGDEILHLVSALTIL